MTAEKDARDEDGFCLDEWGNAYGYCNACGEEAPAYSDCCDDGEVVPPEDTRPIPPAETQESSDD